METKCKSTPAWFRKENPIEIRDDVSFSAFSSDGEVGIMLGQGETDLDIKAEEVAFLFGKDKDELWFCPNFTSCLKVSFDSDEDVVASKLYNQPTGVYRSLSLIKDVRFDVPVYLDALSMIPIAETKGANEGDSDSESTSAQPLDLKGMSLDNTEDEKEIGKASGEYMEATETSYEEIKNVIDIEVEKYGGSVMVRYRAGNNRLHSYDVIEIKQRLFVVVYAEFNGDWLADEASFIGEDPPLWFSSQDHRVSPVFQAMKCRDFFKRELSDISVDSLVVLPKDCIVINDEDMQESWGEKCDTAVVRTAAINETMLRTLREHLASLPADREAPQYNVISMAEIAGRFSTDPENWMTNK